MYQASILKKSCALLLGVISLTGLTSVSSSASEVLTREKIESFYAQSAAVQRLGASMTVKFMQKHISNDSNTTLHMIVNMQGAPQAKKIEVYDKARLISETKKGYEMGDVETIENRVLSTDIAADGRSAKVKDSTFSVFILTMKTPKGMITLRNEQSMFCDGSVTLSANDIIQAMGGVCSVEVNVTPIR